MTEELYKRHRPTSLKDVIGQDAVIGQLVELGRRGEIPHFLLFTGPSGVGKTTVGRILRIKLGCGDSDYREINASSFRGIDMVRDVQRNMHLSPIGGKCRVWMVDESHQLTADAQNAFLKILEDTPSHCWFIFSTTDPQKLKRTVVTRATEMKFGSLSKSHLKKIVAAVVEKEITMRAPSEDVVDRLVDVADGSARKALVLLHAVLGMDDEDRQLEVIAKGESRAKAIELARLLMKPGTPWSTLAELLKLLDEDVEQLRRMVLGYCTKVLLGGGRMSQRAALVIDRFQDATYDSGRAGLVLACYDVIRGE